MSSEDREITLGTGKMLSVFFGLVALCGVFFGLGYSLGRGSSHPLLSTDGNQTASGPALRPSAMKSGTPSQTGDNLTVYKAVEQKDANSQLPAADTPKDETKDPPAAAPAAAPAQDHTTN